MCLKPAAHLPQRLPRRRPHRRGAGRRHGRHLRRARVPFRQAGHHLVSPKRRAKRRIVICASFPARSAVGASVRIGYSFTRGFAAPAPKVAAPAAFSSRVGSGAVPSSRRVGGMTLPRARTRARYGTLRPLPAVLRRSLPLVPLPPPPWEAPSPVIAFAAMAAPTPVPFTVIEGAVDLSAAVPLETESAGRRRSRPLHACGLQSGQRVRLLGRARAPSGACRTPLP
mmetsp:Transcript_35274/g.70064  ORF Transcript_35274/g.70064 Transcript_35274/m.70064 type:complete len:226 (+) Transcript_35274:1179-1856(+)